MPPRRSSLEKPLTTPDIVPMPQGSSKIVVDTAVSAISTPILTTPITGTRPVVPIVSPPQQVTGSNAQPTHLAPVLTVGGLSVTANSASAYVVDGQTASPGGPPITISGDTVVSIAPSGTAAVVNGITQFLSEPSGFVFGTRTLLPGGPPITAADGSVYSIPISGDGIVIDGATVPLPIATEALVLGSQTLVPGGSGITVWGTVISLEAGGSAVVVGGQTESLVPVTRSENIGDYIFSVFGGGILAPVSITASGTGGASSSFAGQTTDEIGSMQTGAADRSTKSNMGSLLTILMIACVEIMMI